MGQRRMQISTSNGSNIIANRYCGPHTFGAAVAARRRFLAPAALGSNLQPPAS